jgi:hypothetical protein
MASARPITSRNLKSKIDSHVLLSNQPNGMERNGSLQPRQAHTPETSTPVPRTNSSIVVENNADGVGDKMNDEPVLPMPLKTEVLYPRREVCSLS